MKKLIIPALFIALIIFGFQEKAHPAEQRPKQTYEYASVKFVPGGRTTLMWADGTVDKLGDLNTAQKPDYADERMYFLTMAINLLAQKGFEPALVPSLEVNATEVWMRRPVSR